MSGTHFRALRACGACEAESFFMNQFLLPRRFQRGIARPLGIRETDFVLDPGRDPGIKGSRQGSRQGGRILRKYIYRYILEYSQITRSRTKSEIFNIEGHSCI